ncbi:MAG: protein translocase subunit SecD [Acidimicrobiia bacterium]|nr:protein translocase subunit SecD [Acidimicrobiia bacterium]
MSRRIVGLLVVLAISWGGMAAALATGTTPRLGLDLQGGTSVVLTAQGESDAETLAVAVEVMRRRIEDLGSVQEPEISISGDDTVEVQLPGVEDEERAVEAVGRTGQLTFHPVLLDESDTASNTCAIGGEPSDEGIVTLPVDDAETTGGPTEITVGQTCLSGRGIAEAVPVPPQGVAGSTQWSVGLTLNSEAATDFAALTGKATQFGDVRRQIAIVLDGTIITAPPVANTVGPEGITGGQASITMSAAETAEQEANDLALVLRYGSLPIAFEVSQVAGVSASVGLGSLEAGIISGLVGLALAILFFLYFYRALGLVAIVGLLVFGSLLVALYGVLGATQGVTLTLAGVTGVIISLGMTCDSFIVYFERIKEELRAGRTVKPVVDSAFKASFRTIVTANMVSLIGAVLLYFLTIGAVRGFALALGLATVLDVLIARFFMKNATAIIARTKLGESGALSVEGAVG